MGQESICKETNAEDGLVKCSSLVSFDGVFNDSVDFDVNGGNGISKVVDDVEKDVEGSSGRMEDGGGVVRSVGIVGVEGTEVRSGVMLSVECRGDASREIGGGEGDGIVGGSEVSGFGGNCRITGNALEIDSDGAKNGERVSDGENGDSSESESEYSSGSESEDSSDSSEYESETSSLSMSSSSSEEDDDVEEDSDEDNEGEVKEKAWEEVEVYAKGMIKDLFVRELFDLSDEEEKAFTKAALLSADEVLPTVPPVAVTLQPCHETLPVGVILSVVGAQLIVEGVEKHDPLNEGSILWITEKRSPLGTVDEIFGPVKNPYYIVRYNSDNEVPTGIQKGTLISFVPEFVNHVLNNGKLYKKGYDASGENDEELSDEAEFSDDEKEAEYQRMQKVSKRGPKAQIIENMKDTKIKAKRRGEQHLSATQPNKRVGQVPSNQSQPSSLLDPRNCSNSFCPVQAFPGGYGSFPMFPQVTQVPGYVAPFNGVWMNKIPFQPPRSIGFPNGFSGFPNGFTSNNIPQFQLNYAQQPYLMLPFNGMPLQQHFSTGQILPSNFVLPVGQPSFGAGATFTPLNPMMMSQNNSGQLQAPIGQNNFCQFQVPINMQGQYSMNFSEAQAPVGWQGLHVPTLTSEGQGVLLTGCQSEQNSNSQSFSATSASSGDS
nr:PREDICTED: H/ACA ribonucleoprotein complex non-core subunit NAF1 isoform X2 [Daucus carota subsp. sativus]